jgi:hypothetical protein
MVQQAGKPNLDLLNPKETRNQNPDSRNRALPTQSLLRKFALAGIFPTFVAQISNLLGASSLRRVDLDGR